MATDNSLTISELARQAGVTLRTIRWYTNAGLLVSLQSKGLRASYPAGALPTLLRIQSLADSGLSLAAIKSIMDDARKGATARKRLTMRLRREIEVRRQSLYEKENRLRTVRDELDRVLAQTAGCPPCPAQGPDQECAGCGNLQVLKGVFI